MTATTKSDPEQVKAAALNTIDAIARGDVRALDDSLDPDISWRVMGADYMPSAGKYEGKQAVMADLIATMASVFEIGTFDIDIRNVLVDGDAVVVECRLSVQTITGAEYRDVDYCFVLGVRDGLVRTIREYTNTAYAKRVLFDPAP